MQNRVPGRSLNPWSISRSILVTSPLLISLIFPCVTFAIALSGVKTQSPPFPFPPVVGQPFTYQIVVENTGATSIDVLYVVDTAPPMLTAVTTDAPAVMGPPTVTQGVGGTRYEWSGSGLSMTPGTVYTFTITGIVDGTTSSTSGGVCASAHIIAIDVISATVEMDTNTTCSFWECVPNMDVWVDSTPSVACTGDVIEYRISFSNYADCTAWSVLLTVHDGSFSERSYHQAFIPPSPFWVSGGAGFVSLRWATSLSGPWSINPPESTPEPLYLRWLLSKVGSHQSGYVKYRVHVEPGASPLLPIYVSATMHSGVPTFVPSTVPYTATGTGQRGTAASLSVLMTQVPLTPGVGEVVTYRIDIRNTGAATLTDLVLVDTVSPVVTSVTTTEPAGFAAPLVTQQPGSGTRYEWSRSGFMMLPGTTYSFTLTGIVGPVSVSTPVSNRAWLEGSRNGSCGTQMTTNSTGFTVSPTVLGLTATKLQTPAAPNSGESVTYRIVVRNTGAATISGLTVVDTVSPVIMGVATDEPAGFTAVAPVQVSGGTRYAWSANGLNFLPGTTFTFTITGTVGTVAVPTAVCNTAHITGIDTGSTAQLTTNTTCFTAAPPAILESSLTVSPSTRQVGEAITLTLTVTNAGGSTATGVMPDLQITAGASLVVATGGPSPAGPVTLGPGSVQTFTWTFTATGDGTVSFAVSVSGTDASSGVGLSTVTSQDVVIQPLPLGTAVVTGGVNGYINPTMGEQATIEVFPIGSSPIEVIIYDMNGSLVRHFMASTTGLPVIFYWDGRDSFGALVPPGGYPVYIAGPGFSHTDTIGVLY